MSSTVLHFSAHHNLVTLGTLPHRIKHLSIHVARLSDL